MDRILPRGIDKKVIFSYVGDYVILFVIFVIFISLDFLTPHHQEFSLRNYTLQYKYAVHERVPVWLLYLLAAIFPGAVILLYTVFLDGLFSSTGIGRRKYSLKDRLWELNCGWLGLALAFGAAFDITGAFKNAIGKPRPDLIDRCQPLAGSADPAPFGLSNYTICTNTDQAVMNDGFKSFPSGHSSTSFAGLFFLSLYLAGKLHILDTRGEVWKTVIVIAPTVGAGLIAGSRIMDARHHPFDVISGSVLGILCAWWAYHIYFPPLSDFRAKGRAYPMRSWGSISDRLARTPHQEVSTTLEDEYTHYDGPERQGTGNYFREEMHASQRRRRQEDESEDLADVELVERPIQPTRVI